MYETATIFEGIGHGVTVGLATWWTAVLIGWSLALIMCALRG